MYHKILDVAEDLIQRQGFHAFSYKDVSMKVGIKTSSIHYHFPTKNDLGKKVIERCGLVIEDHLNGIIKSKLKPKQKLNEIVEAIFALTFEKDRKMCLGGMLAIDALMLDEGILKEVQNFFDMLEISIMTVLREAKMDASLTVSTDLRELARIIVSMIEGCLLLSRLFNQKQRMSELKAFLQQIFK